MRITSARVTASEVARKAGVSQAAVSLVLSRNPKARFAEETRARIIQAAAELGYRPNLVARALVNRRSFALGVLVPSLGDPVYAAIVSGAKRVASETGHALLLAEATADDQVAQLRALADRQIDGVIIAGVLAASLPAEELAALHVVIVNQPSAHFSTLAEDSIRAGAIAAEHFLGLGHSRIAFIGPASSSHVFRHRERGFAQAVRASGTAMQSEYWQRADATVAGGVAAMRTLLALHERPTAVFCANDLSALGAHKACTAAGVQLGKELSLLGCDDIEIGTLVTPELSTIHTPLGELGARAVRDLLSQQDIPRVVPAAKTLPVKLVIRGTTGRPAASPPGA